MSCFQLLKRVWPWWFLNYKKWTCFGIKKVIPFEKYSSMTRGPPTNLKIFYAARGGAFSIHKLLDFRSILFVWPVFRRHKSLHIFRIVGTFASLECRNFSFFPVSHEYWWIDEEHLRTVLKQSERMVSLLMEFLETGEYFRICFLYQSRWVEFLSVSFIKIWVWAYSKTFLKVFWKDFLEDKLDGSA